MSSKLSSRRGVPTRPHVCHPPPPPPPLIPPPPPPPTCPPAAIGGYMDATVWGEHYYSSYTAPKQETEYGWEYRDEHWNTAGHLLIISMTEDPPVLSITLEITTESGGGTIFEKGETSFEWCQHQNITITEWDMPDPWEGTCELRMIW